MNEIDACYQKRVLEAINQFYKHIINKEDDDFILDFYKNLKALEPDQQKFAELLIDEAIKNFRSKSTMLINKVATIAMALEELERKL